MMFMITAVYCEDSVVVLNAHILVTSLIYTSYALVTCYDGYSFPDHTLIRSVVCQRDGTWSITLMSCAGKIVYYFLLLIWYRTKIGSKMWSTRNPI